MINVTFKLWGGRVVGGTFLMPTVPRLGELVDVIPDPDFYLGVVSRITWHINALSQTSATVELVPFEDAEDYLRSLESSFVERAL